MARVSSPKSVATPPSRAKRFLLAAMYLLSISGLIVWEYRDHIEAISPACETADPETKAAFYSVVYKRMLGWASGEKATRVSVVAIPLELDDIQNNVCQRRTQARRTKNSRAVGNLLFPVPEGSLRLLFASRQRLEV